MKKTKQLICKIRHCFQTPLVTETEMEVDDSKQDKALIPLETGSGESIDVNTIIEKTFFCDWLMLLVFKEIMMMN